MLPLMIVSRAIASTQSSHRSTDVITKFTERPIYVEDSCFKALKWNMQVSRSDFDTFTAAECL